MKAADDLLKYDSLAFFGKVNASISHELKNVMAIISETAGLLGDLAGLAATGRPVGPDVLKNTADSILEEIERGFFTIRQMNRFAHSVDTPIHTVNLLETLDLVKSLSAFLSFAGTARIVVGEADNPVVSSCPFLLQTVLYQALVAAYKCAGPGKEVTVALESNNSPGWTVSFSGFAGVATSFPDDATTDAARRIGVRIQLDDRAGLLAVAIPDTLEGGGG